MKDVGHHVILGVARPYKEDHDDRQNGLYHDAWWADILTIWCVLVDDAYQALQPHVGAWRQRGPTPRVSDSDVMTVALMIDTCLHGHAARGLAFLRQYAPPLVPALPAEGHLNERRRALHLMIEQVRRQLTATPQVLAADDRCRLMESAPVPVWTYGRASSNGTLAGRAYFSVMASRKAKLFGLRLYLTTSTEQVVDRWLLAPAAPHDSKVMAAVLADDHDLIGLGDSAFHDPVASERLQRQHNIQVWATPRKDTRQPWPDQVRHWVTRIRRRVATALRVLVTVFNVEHLQARSLTGLITRVATRLLAYNLCLVMQSYLTQLNRKTPN